MPPVDLGPILVIDDDADIRGALLDTLELEGYRAVAASDGSEALSYIRANPPPPLIFLDWNMAPMNAQQFMSELANEPGSHHVPVVLLTADMNVELKMQSGRYAGYLRKPVKLDALFALVGRFVGR